ncbi:hypothetical protein SNE40_019256 [Patella caerulea]|uniref:Thioredoxin-like fold domain-containing protein n=1 Tax=Patella caerulea TaxID=87958 RepID=A0AAN8PI64_PATCE
MEAIVGSKVEKVNGDVIPVKSICGPGTIIGILFTWSGSILCQQYLPKVIEFYKSYHFKTNKNENFQIIALIDNEKTETQWKAYRKTMPWLAVPYSNIQVLKKRFSNVDGYPTLQMYDSVSGKLLSPDIMSRVLRGSYDPFKMNSDDYVDS